MSAQAFGNALRQYIGKYPPTSLADCMYSKHRFAPKGVRSAAELEAHLLNIIAGQRWPFTSSDLTPFVAAVVECTKPRDTAAEVNFKFAGAQYSTELGP